MEKENYIQNKPAAYGNSMFAKLSAALVLLFLLPAWMEAYGQIETENETGIKPYDPREEVGKPRKFLGERSEEAACEFTYVVRESKNTYVIYNKSNTLMLLQSSFYTWWSSGMGIKSLKVSSRPVLDSLVHKRISPHLKSYDGGSGHLNVVLYSDIDGNIKEVMFSFAKPADIPLAAMELLEKDIFASGLRLVFDKNERIFWDTSWVEMGYEYSLEKLKAAANGGE